MLHIDKSKIKITGNKIDHVVELSMLMRELLSQNFLSKEDIDRCVSNAKKSDEELDKESAEAMERILSSIHELFAKMDEHNDKSHSDNSNSKDDEQSKVFDDILNFLRDEKK